jgi:hypothetical protein
MPIDRVASIVASARTMRMACDPSVVDIKVNAAQLALILDTFIDVAAPPTNMKLTDAAARAVGGRTVEITNAAKARDDRQRLSGG